MERAAPSSTLERSSSILLSLSMVLSRRAVRCNFLVEFHILLTGLEALVLERNIRNTWWWSDRVLWLSLARSLKLLDHE